MTIHSTSTTGPKRITAMGRTAFRPNAVIAPFRFWGKLAGWRVLILLHVIFSNSCTSNLPPLKCSFFDLPSFARREVSVVREPGKD